MFIELSPKRCPIPGGRIFKSGDLNVLVSCDYGKMHLSISHPSRYPTWDEIKAAVYEILPQPRTYAMYFPPKEQFVNVHPNCFHVYETDGV